jgi:probable rRNA maturation factor
MILLDKDLEPDRALKAASATRGAARGAQQKSAEFRMPSARSLARFLKAAQGAVRLKGQVTVLLTTDAAIADLNRRFRGKNETTDVLSFSAEGLGAEGIAGDLAISVSTAMRQAAGQGHSLAAEIKVLILHGLLHLAGGDHEVDAGRMARRERMLRGRLGLPLGLIERAAKKDFPQGLKPRTSFGQSSARLKSCPFKAPKPQAKTDAVAKGEERTSGARARIDCKPALRGLKAPAPSAPDPSAPNPSAPAPSKRSGEATKSADVVRGKRL